MASSIHFSCKAAPAPSFVHSLFSSVLKALPAKPGLSSFGEGRSRLPGGHEGAVVQVHLLSPVLTDQDCQQAVWRRRKRVFGPPLPRPPSNLFSLAAEWKQALYLEVSREGAAALG